MKDRRYAKKIEEVTGTVLDCYFKHEVMPILKRYNWIIVWNMGAVTIFNSKGEDMDHTNTVKKLYKKFEKEFEYINTYQDCDPFWFLMCNSKTNWSNCGYGKYELSCYDPLK